MRAAAACTIHLNPPQNNNQKHAKALFNEYGDVEGARMCAGQCYGFVEFATAVAAAAVLDALRDEGVLLFFRNEHTTLNKQPQHHN